MKCYLFKKITQVLQPRESARVNQFYLKTYAFEAAINYIIDRTYEQYACCFNRKHIAAEPRDELTHMNVERIFDD